MSAIAREPSPTELLPPPWEPARVQRFRSRTVKVPLKKPVLTAAGLVSHAAMLLLDVECDDGTRGSTYAFTDTPLALPAIRRLLDDLCATLVGQPLAPVAAYGALRRRLRLIGTPGIVGIVLAAIDMVLWDALAQAVQLPLVRLLGGEPGPVKAYASFGMSDPDTAARHAAQAVEEGFEVVKVKIGHPTLAEDLRVVRAVRKAVGEGIELLVDYNQFLSPAQAVVRGTALDAEGIGWIEEPVAYDDFSGAARVAAAVSTPVQMGENLWGPREVHKCIAAGASDLMMLDLMKAGGITGWLRCAALCDAVDMPISSHVFPEVSAQLLRVSPNPHYLEQIDLAAPLLREPLRFERGHAIVRDAPGSGIVWNDDAVERYLV